MPIKSAKKQNRTAPKSKRYRFELCLNQAQKLLIQRAADLEGRSMTDFVLHSAEIAAKRTIERRATLVFTERETEAFVDAVLSPSNPGSVLRRAARDYRQKTVVG
jgi:uncharacterized protein (DUF1778 family)